MTNCCSGPDRVVRPIRHQTYDHTDEVHGLYFELGWQADRLYYDLLCNGAWLYLGLVVIWICVLFWAQPKGDWSTVCLELIVIWLCVLFWAQPKKDWSTAMTFGQLVAACFTLLVSYT